MNDVIRSILLLAGLIIFLLLVTSKCSLAPPTDAKKAYKLDIKIETKEVRASGMIVLPIKKKYIITLRTPGKMDILYLKTCARDDVVERARSGLNAKKAVIHFTPNEIEKEGACPIKVESYSKKSRHAIGFIDFQTEDTTLPALVVCGKKNIKFTGVSKCQGAVGSMKRIKFDNEVMVKYDDKCFMKPDAEGRVVGYFKGKVFEYFMIKGYCPFAFRETKPPYRRHRLTTYGWEVTKFRRQ